MIARKVVLLYQTYPDGEIVYYHYNKGGLLDSIAGAKTHIYNYVDKIGYDKFEQQIYLKYGNGIETTFAYDPNVRRLTNHNVVNGDVGYVKKLYMYNKVGNIIQINNNPTFDINYDMPIYSMIRLNYDNLYRLTFANCGYFNNWELPESENGSYLLYMTYDNLHNIVNKRLTASCDEYTNTMQQISYINSGYELDYEYNPSKPYQIASIDDNSYQTDINAVTDNDRTWRKHAYEYDLNGNLTYVNTARKKKDGSQDAGSSERKLRWDEENRLMAVSDNGYVSNYLYDASGERVVKTSGGNQAIYVNGEFSGGLTATSNYTLYVNPYLVVSAGAKYTKHIYAGSQRIVSKIGDTESFLGDPYTSNCAGNGLLNVDYAAKYTQSVQTIRDNYTHFDEVYRGADNNDTPGSCYCNFNQSYSLLASANNFEPARENYQYFYHSDHLGSTSMTTDADGNISQRIQYLPFGEVFVEKRNTNWNTPFLFNAKELDEETGLCYYGARYYDPRTSLWLSADPLGEKYPGVSPYAYCMNNPVRLIDPDGRDWDITKTTKDGTDYYNITVNGVLYNNSSKQYDLGSLQSIISQQISDVYNVSGDGFVSEMTLNLRTVSSVNEIRDSDHVFQIVDQSFIQTGASAQADAQGGLNILFGTDVIERMLDGKNNRVAAHELGHTGGLDEADSRYNSVKVNSLINNIMTQSKEIQRLEGNRMNARNLERGQLESIWSHYSSGQLNQKSAINYKFSGIGISYYLQFNKKYTRELRKWTYPMIIKK